MKLPRLNVIKNIRDQLHDTNRLVPETLLKNVERTIDSRHSNDPVLWNKFNARALAILPDFTFVL